MVSKYISKNGYDMVKSTGAMNGQTIDQVKERYVRNIQECMKSDTLLRRASKLITDTRLTLAASRLELQVSRAALEHSQQCEVNSLISSMTNGDETAQPDKHGPMARGVSMDAYIAASRWFQYLSGTMPMLPPRDEFRDLSLAVADAEVPAYASLTFRQMFVRAFHQWCLRLYEKAERPSARL